MTLKISMWSKVQIAIESALAAAKTITGITKASPGVVTSVAHGYADGDFILLTIQGMFQLEGRVFRVDNKTDDTYELEGEDTTLYGDFSSGTSEKITFGTTLAATLGLTGGGGGFKMEPVTTIHDDRDIEIPGNANASNYNLDNIWDVSDAGLIALKYASDNKIRRCMKISFANAQKTVFTGYIACNLLPGGSAPGKVTTPAVVTMFGAPTHYAT